MKTNLPDVERPDALLFSSDYRNPKIYSFGSSLERRTRVGTLWAAYRWTRGVHLGRFFDLNRSDPEWDGRTFQIPANGGPRIDGGECRLTGRCGPGSVSSVDVVSRVGRGKTPSRIQI